MAWNYIGLIRLINLCPRRKRTCPHCLFIKLGKPTNRVVGGGGGGGAGQPVEASSQKNSSGSEPVIVLGSHDQTTHRNSQAVSFALQLCKNVVSISNVWRGLRFSFTTCCHWELEKYTVRLCISAIVEMLSLASAGGVKGLDYGGFCSTDIFHCSFMHIAW